MAVPITKLFAGGGGLRGEDMCYECVRSLLVLQASFMALLGYRSLLG